VPKVFIRWINGSGNTGIEFFVDIVQALSGSATFDELLPSLGSRQSQTSCQRNCPFINYNHISGAKVASKLF